MRAAKVELADVLRGYARQVSGCYPASLAQRKIIDDLMACRTAALGGHRRHCPKCQKQKQADWLDKQSEQLLNVPYFHLVFTLPGQLSPLALQNQRLLYGLLFRCASGALLRIAGDPKHLGARIGFTAILHTWGQP